MRAWIKLFLQPVLPHTDVNILKFTFKLHLLDIAQLRLTLIRLVKKKKKCIIGHQIKEKFIATGSGWVAKETSHVKLSLGVGSPTLEQRWPSSGPALLSELGQLVFLDLHFPFFKKGGEKEQW